ncbi:MAG TPA: LysR family transcriptional regulator [Blastocatellia bacterium]|nr:LysR family transcriptional regulator [Blastocatellia bacterium]
MSYVNLNLRQLQSFVTVGRVKSFTRAARLLHVSQPALTKQIRQLEETLGVRLLDRNTKSVELTRIGRELSPVIDRLLREVEAVVLNTRELAAKGTGVIRIAALPSVSSTILPRAVARFREIYPGVSVILKDVIAQQLIAMVKSEEADFGIGSFSEADPEIRFTPLLTDQLVVVFQPESAFERKKAVPLKDLVGLPLVLMDPKSGVRRLVDRAFESIGTFATPIMEATYMSTAAGIVKAGLGVTILPSTALEMGEMNGLRSRPISAPAIKRELGVVQKSGRSLSPAAESFLKTMTTMCNELSH